MAEGASPAPQGQREPVDWDALEANAPPDFEARWVQLAERLDDLARTIEPSGAVRPSQVSTATPSTHGLSPAAFGTWGKYVLREKIGEGGFGAVYRALDPLLNRVIAIKILHERVSDAWLKAALIKEGQALARIDHPNVVRVFDIAENGDQLGLCMELVEGVTLEALVAQHGTLSAQEAALIGADVCRALAAVHIDDFVHRDVKARNVMRRKAGRIVLMDFGAGRLAQDLQVRGQEPNIGTPLYMAPEVLVGEAASKASDVYSVGVLLYYMVTGEYPVEGAGVSGLRLSHMQGRRRPLLGRRSDLPIAYARIVEKALEPDTTRRYKDAAELLLDLSALTERPAALVSPSPWRRAQAALLGVAGAVLLLGLLGWITSLEFTSALGHGRFVHESPLDWVRWGARASLGTLATLLLVIGVGALLFGLHHLLVMLVPAAASVNARAAAWADASVRLWRLDDHHVRGALLLLCAAASLVAGWLYFQDFFADLLLAGNLWSAPPEKLALLAPSNRPFQWFFRKVFTGELIGSLTALGIAWRLAPVHKDLPYRLLLAGVVAVVLLSLFTLVLPFRVLYHAEFDVVRWNGAECYALGADRDETLLFCPTMQPRLQLASPLAGALPELVRHDENIFTVFGVNQVSSRR
ncbi:MAG: serine/threonine-protein kinase [Vicinamibacterales bacterium]